MKTMADTAMDAMDEAFGAVPSASASGRVSIVAAVSSSRASRAAGRGSIDAHLLSQHALPALPSTAMHRRLQAAAVLRTLPPELLSRAPTGSRGRSGSGRSRPAVPSPVSAWKSPLPRRDDPRGAQASASASSLSQATGIAQAASDARALSQLPEDPYRREASLPLTVASGAGRSTEHQWTLAQASLGGAGDPTTVSVPWLPLSVGLVGHEGDEPPGSSRFERVLPCSTDGCLSLCASIELPSPAADNAAEAVGQLLQETASALRFLEGAGPAFVAALKGGSLSGMASTPVAAPRPSTAPAAISTEGAQQPTSSAAEHAAGLSPIELDETAPSSDTDSDGGAEAKTQEGAEQQEAPVWGTVAPTATGAWSDSDD
jgi:hypothetical protein